jgi:hypothetical protein
MGKNKKNTLKKKSQIHLLMIGGLLLIAVIVLFAVLNITKDTKENIKDTEEDTKKSSSIIVSPNIVKLNPITCNNNESATIDLSWNPIVGFGEYYVVVETPDKKQLNVTVESTGTNKLDVDNLDDKITFDIPANQCNDTFYVKIEVTKDNQKEESLQKKIYFNITHQIPPEEECSVIPENGEIYYLEHLAYIDTNADTLSGSYTLTRNLDFSDSDSYCDNSYMQQWTEGEGWEPIGSQEAPFTGEFNGDDYTISNLYINRLLVDNQGLFGLISKATLENISLENINITGKNTCGGLAGGAMGTPSENLQINSIFLTGSVSGNDFVGGLFGFLTNVSTTLNCEFNGSVTGNEYVGGLIGHISNNYLNEINTVLKSKSIGNVFGNDYVGGFIGYSYGKNISILESFSNSNATGGLRVGGFIGQNYLADFSKCYATGNVYGNGILGGFLGINAGGLISNSYALGDITLYVLDDMYLESAAGFVTYSYLGGASITKSYSTGSIIYENNTNPTDKGFSIDSVSENCYWNIDTSSQSTSGENEIGLTDSQMKNSDSFDGWDFETVWAIDQGNSYPYLIDNPQDPLPGSIE